MILKNSGDIKKYLVFLIFFSLILIPIVQAEKITQLNTADNGFEIVYPTFEVYKYNQHVELSFHVYNLSYGNILFNDIYSCSFHLYDKYGIEVYDNHTLIKAENLEDVTIQLDPTILNYTGEFNYIVSCNTTNEGGFISSNFQLTKNGETDNNNSWAVGLGVILVGILFFLIYVASTLEEEHAGLKLFLNSLALYFIVAVLWIAKSIADLGSKSIGNLTLLIFRGYLAFITFFTFYLVVVFIIWLIEVLRNYGKPQKTEED